ncbi:MAG: TldD/PmbA family protein [Chloroflexota bacterium]
MEDILAAARLVSEAAEVFTVSSEETVVHFEANHLKQLQTRQRTSVALRLVKDGRVGFATASGKVDAAAIVDNALETAQFGTEVKFRFPEKSRYPEVAVFDQAAGGVPVAEMVRLGTEMIDRVREKSPEIVCEASVDKTDVSVRLMNSQGGEAAYRKSVFDMALEGSITRGTDMLFVGESQSSCHPLTDTGVITAEVLRQLEWAQNNIPTPTGTLPVIFTPAGVASALLFPLMAAFSGKTVLEGASPIGQKVGEQVFDPQLSLWDDATLDYRPGSRPCDDEGVPSRLTALVDKGVVGGFLYDLQTAALAGKESTGNGSRAHGIPSPAASALVVGTGKATFAEMLADVKEGLVIEYLMGATQGNVLGGDFSGNVLLGYRVENGKIVGRVKDTMVYGNVYQVLREVSAVGKEAKWVGGSLLAPYLYCPRVSVATRG